MTVEQRERTKRAKRRQQEQKTVFHEDERIQKIASLLEELAKERTFIDIHICPHCKSARVERVEGVGDMTGHWTMSNPKFECLDCGWRGRLTMYATNRPGSLKGTAIVAEAYAQHHSEIMETVR